jgi:C4-dicarboxylate transporter, DctM subunit
MRAGVFTPTEAAVMAVFYGLFVGFVVYRSLTLRDLYEMLVEAAEVSAVILMVVALASVFAWSTSTLGMVQPIAYSFDWDLTWFGVILTMTVAIGQVTPPMAVNLMVSCRIAGVPMESTVPRVLWKVLAMALALAAVVLFPGLALWLPRTMGLS